MAKLKNGDRKIIKLVLSVERASEMLFPNERSLRKESLLKRIGNYVCSVHCIHYVPGALVTPTMTAKKT